MESLPAPQEDLLEPQVFSQTELSGEDSASPEASPSANQHPKPACLSPRSLKIRLIAVMIALLPLSLLGVARTLQPNRQGLGTHQQLGLPPCSLRVLAGIRCPACGMTTSWAYFVRGNWVASGRTNLGGFLLACFSLGVVVMSIPVIRTGTPPSITQQKWLTYVLAGVMLVTLLDWAVRLQA